MQECKIEHPVLNGFAVHPSPGGPAGQPAGAEAVANQAKGEERKLYMDPKVIDPFKLMEPNLRVLRDNMKLLVTTDNPLLQKVSRTLRHLFGPWAGLRTERSSLERSV